MGEGPSLRSLLLEHLHLARTLRRLEIHYDPGSCSGVWECYQVCPVDCWTPDYEKQVVLFHHPERCIACGACVLQCPQRAIELRIPNG